MTVKKDSNIYIVGADTAIGAAIVRELDAQDYSAVYAPGARQSETLVDIEARTRSPVIEAGGGEESDVTDDDASSAYAADLDADFEERKPEYVFVAAGRTGGIAANRARPVELMIDNLNVVTEVLTAARQHSVKKLLYLASSCSYPRDCAQPMKEEDLFKGPPESTSAAYATAKRAGIRLCQAFNRQYGTKFIPAIPSNPFGPGEDFGSDTAHVVEALIRRMHEAELERSPYVDVWGSGEPVRDFIFLDDLANACIHVMSEYKGAEVINIGTGEGISIRELAYAVKLVTGYSGEIRFDTSRPDGMPEKVLDTAKLEALGWSPKTSFLEALERTYIGYSERFANAA